MSWTAKISALLIAVIVALVAGYGFGNKAGADRIRVQWSAERQAVADQRAKEEQAARAEEKRRAEQAQVVLEDQARREALARDRAVRAERTVVGLRDEVARLNARPAPSDTKAAGFAHEARVARELLGACTKEYGSLAAAADSLRDQVTGLQQWVSHVTQ